SWAAFDSRTSCPSSSIVPAVGSTMRLIMRSEVVLPHPDGPTRTVIVPSAARRLKSCTATVPPGYRLVTCWNSIPMVVLSWSFAPRLWDMRPAGYGRGRRQTLDDLARSNTRLPSRGKLHHTALDTSGRQY